MAKTSTTEQTAQTSPDVDTLKLPITATVQLAEFEDKDKVKREYVGIELVNPFPGVELDGFKLSAKWKSDKGVFDFKARQALKTTDTFTVSGYFYASTFFSKRLKRKMTMVGIKIINPFFAGEIEFVLKDEGQYAVVALLLSELWGIKLSRYSDNPELATDEIAPGTSLRA